MFKFEGVGDSFHAGVHGNDFDALVMVECWPDVPTIDGMCASNLLCWTMSWVVH